MTCSPTAIIAVVMAFAWSVSASAHSPGAHVHGLADLEIAIDGETVQVNLITPLNNLVGFEHAPGNEKQRQAVKSMASKLHQADNLFILTPAAQCRLMSVKLESPLLRPNCWCWLPWLAKAQIRRLGGPAMQAGPSRTMCMESWKPPGIFNVRIRRLCREWM